MLDMNIYKYADVLECEYANVYEYKLVETQKMEKYKRKKRHLVPVGKCSTCGACMADRPVLKYTFSTGLPVRY